MKLVFGSAAALFLASAAMAQTATPMEPAPPAPEAAPTPAPAPEVAMLTERDGKWWNGDREATPAEIEAYKKAQKAPKPR